MFARFNKRSINDGDKPAINSDCSFSISSGDIPARRLLFSASISCLCCSSKEACEGFGDRSPAWGDLEPLEGLMVWEELALVDVSSLVLRCLNLDCPERFWCLGKPVEDFS